MNYDETMPNANKLLNPDGSVVTMNGELILPADEERAKLYDSMSPRANKHLNPDGSVGTADNTGDGSNGSNGSNGIGDNGVTIAHTTGQSERAVMSQKAVTDNLAADKIGAEPAFDVLAPAKGGTGVSFDADNGDGGKIIAMPKDGGAECTLYGFANSVPVEYGDDMVLSASVVKGLLDEISENLQTVPPPVGSATYVITAANTTLSVSQATILWVNISSSAPNNVTLKFTAGDVDIGSLKIVFIKQLGGGKNVTISGVTWLNGEPEVPVSENGLAYFSAIWNSTVLYGLWNGCTN